MISSHVTITFKVKVLTGEYEVAKLSVLSKGFAGMLEALYQPV